MRYRLVCVGKFRETYVAAAVDDFTRRLRRYETLDIVEVNASHATDPQRARSDEGAAILRRVDPNDKMWLLDLAGVQMSSVELAQRLAALALDGTSRLVLVVAGTFGAAEAVIERADLRWSLSALTLLHEWARALVVEQLYRAAKIARNEPYHH